MDNVYGGCEFRSEYWARFVRAEAMMAGYSSVRFHRPEDSAYLRARPGEAYVLYLPRGVAPIRIYESCEPTSQYT